ncbi:hypothetical protein K470DRAFT_259379 [Piedraia hortae CBS 480.64]|uniref:Uncharacterized protein n=1 Tax=Piedraia hortae CBS 480.64 TaxID=1314780 RepID=A0A6A7BV84_9PEZI|nr:hypothetical protein K470DRAFT_259379 [Piedraia hortae CBS 480.64]
MASSILPLVILLLIVAIAATVGYQIYLWSVKVSAEGKNKLQKKNVNLHRDGMKIGVKQLSEEEYEGRTQRYVYFGLDGGGCY